METSSIVFNSKHLSKVCIQHFSPFDIKSNVQLAKKKKQTKIEGTIVKGDFIIGISFEE